MTGTARTRAAERAAQLAQEWREAYPLLSPEMEALQVVGALTLGSVFGPESRLLLLEPWGGEIENVPRAELPALIRDAYGMMIANAEMALLMARGMRH